MLKRVVTMKRRVQVARMKAAADALPPPRSMSELLKLLNDTGEVEAPIQAAH